MALNDVIALSLRYFNEFDSFGGQLRPKKPDHIKTFDISLDSVATHLRCDEIFSDSITTNFLPILTVK